MKLIEFPGINTVYAKDQPQYFPLPARLIDGAEGQMICCWQLTFKERLKILFTGKIWHSVLTFKHPLQPQLLTVDEPFEVTERRTNTGTI
jgi:hypothetical protein